MVGRCSPDDYSFRMKPSGRPATQSEHARSSDLKSLTAIWSGAAVGALASFLVTLLLGNALSNEEFGAYSAVAATVAILSPLVGLGLPGFALRAGVRAQSVYVRVLRAARGYYDVSSVAAMIVALAWATVAFEDGALRLAAVLAVPAVLLVPAVELEASVLQLGGRFGRLAWWQSLPQLLRLGSALLAIAISHATAMDERLTLVLGLYSFSAIVVAMGTRYRLSRGPGGVLSSSFRLSGLGRLLSRSWAFGAGTLLYLVGMQGALVVLGAMGQLEAASSFAVCVTILTAIYVFPNVLLNRLVTARIHSAAASRPLEAARIAVRAALAAVAIGIVAAFALRIGSAWILNLLFGEKFGDAADVFAVLCIGIPIRFGAMGLGSVLVSRGFMPQKVLAMTAAAVSAVLGSALLVESSGAVGVAAAQVAGELVLAVLYAVLFVRWKAAATVTETR